MVTGSADIKAWLIAHDGNLSENDPQPFLVGPIMQIRPGKDHRHLIEYNSEVLESLENGTETEIHARGNLMLPYKVSTAVCMPNGDLVFYGDDISTACFLTFEEFEAWLAENQAPLTSEWVDMEEVDIDETSEPADYDADGNVIQYY